MKLVSELFETPVDAPGYWVRPYQLNVVLGWRPWEPCACSVWASPVPTAIWQDHDEFHTTDATWSRLRAVLDGLHVEYMKRKGET